MEYSTFYVFERPQVYWDWKLRRKNLEFLRGIDPQYYDHVVEVNAPCLDEESKLQAAAAIRMAYSQGLETLFALMCAGMQAADCVVGWMQSYRNKELSDMVAAISSHRPPTVPSGFRPATWDSMASHVHSCVAWDEDKKAWVTKGFARMWSRFAREFLDERNVQEYNALKHGARPRLGGFSISFGVEPSPGVPAPPEAMRSMGGSDFGSSFFVEERLGDGRLHCRPRNVSVNWVPENLANGLLLVSMSIQNVVGFLRIVNGDEPADCRFLAPTEEESFELPWAKHCGVNSSSMDSRVTIDDVEPWTKDEVVAAIRKSYGISS